jgi:hypothetical protein
VSSTVYPKAGGKSIPGQILEIRPTNIQIRQPHINAHSAVGPFYVYPYSNITAVGNPDPLRNPRITPSKNNISSVIAIISIS